VNISRAAGTSGGLAARLPRLATAAVLAVALGGIAVPLASAAPAHASTTTNECTVTPLTPVAYSTSKKTANFRVRVTCAAGRTIQFQQRAYYQGQAQPIGLLYRDFVLGFPWAETRTEPRILTVPNYHPKGQEYAFHDVRFTVKKNGSWSKWTGLEQSPTGSLNW
jgi:hypothetical protein